MVWNKCSRRKATELIPFQDPPDDDFRERIQKLEKSADKLGLYMQGAALGGLPGHGDDDDEEENVATLLLATFAVGSEAFSDRVMNPDKYDEDGKFRELAIEADPSEMLFEELRQEYLEKGLAEEAEDEEED